MDKADQTYIAPEDIISCEEEKIHLIGSIQQHGYLMSVNLASHIVEYASDNCKELFGGFDPLGQAISKLDDHFKSYEGKNILSEYYNLQTAGERRPDTYKLKVNGENYILVSYFSENRFTFEFEPAESLDVSLKTQSILGEIMIKMSPQSHSLGNLMQMVADEVKMLLGYDRVMIYKFWEDWHGEVIAEAKNDNLEPFKGLHYPATDIPKQARELYKRKITRLLVNVQADQIPVRSVKNEPLDLSDSNLRSISPVHIEYLTNMGVAATFTISLIFKGELWGMISCRCLLSVTSCFGVQQSL